MGGNLGIEVDLGRVPTDQLDRNDVVLFSESAGRFIVTVDPENQEAFEEIFNGLDCAGIGTVTDKSNFRIKGIDGRTLIDVPVQDLKSAWKKPFGDLI